MLPLMTLPAVAPACYVPKYDIETSQVFRGGQYLSRVQVAGNRQQFGFAFWLQPGVLNTYMHLTQGFSANYEGLYLYGDQLYAYFVPGGNQIMLNRKLRDLDAPMHLVWLTDTTEPTATDRWKVYVDGVRDTDVTASVNGWPTLDYQTQHIGVAGRAMNIGRNGDGQYYFKGLLSDHLFVDGPCTIDDFGEWNIHGGWVPKDPAAVIAASGPNSHHLDFADPLSPGTDVSGKGNHFTATGFDGAGRDTAVTSPTNVTAALSVLAKNASYTVSEGGTRAVSVGSGVVPLTLPVADGAYFEVTVVANSQNAAEIQLIPSDRAAQWSGSLRYGAESGAVVVAGNHLVTIAATAVGQTCGLAYKDGRVWVRPGSGVWDGDPVAGTGGYDVSGFAGPLYFAVGDPTGLGDSTVVVNAGMMPWVHGVPDGFGPVCTAVMPEPTVKDPADGYAGETATGANLLAVLDAATAHWGGADYVEIIKRRDGIEGWRLRWSDDPANAMATDTTAVKAAAPALAAAGSYAGWRLRLGTKYGRWTAEVAHVTGIATTVTHGMGVTRNVVIAKRVDDTGGDWFIRHPDFPTGELAKLNSTAAAGADGTLTAFGADSFQIAATAPSGTYRVTVLAEIEGHQALDTYTANNSADGPYVPCGLLADLLLTKPYNAADAWDLRSSVLNTVNPTTTSLAINSAGAQADQSGAVCDLVVGGVKWRGINAGTNAANTTTKYATIAIGRPVGGVCVAPAPAR